MTMISNNNPTTSVTIQKGKLEFVLAFFSGDPKTLVKVDII